MFTMEINFPHEGFPRRAAVSAGNQRGSCRSRLQRLSMKMGFRNARRRF